MEIIPMLLNEMEQEANTTRKMLQLVPNDKLGWKPHEKSMTMGHLAVHVAELPSWVSMTLNSDELDFAKSGFNDKTVANNEELMQYFEDNLREARADLPNTNEEVLMQPWTLRNGDQIYSTRPKHEVIRMAYCQTVHHRAQLGVYLRLLNIPLPGSYGPSADEGFQAK